MTGLLMQLIFLLVIFCCIGICRQSCSSESCHASRDSLPSATNEKGTSGPSKSKKNQNTPKPHLSPNIIMKTPMAKIESNRFVIGLEKAIMPQDGESPQRNVEVDTFYIDMYEVSNTDFEVFTNATGYVTEAEAFGDSFVLENLLSENTNRKTKKAVAETPWWLMVQGANWRHPEGPDSDLKGRMDLPVVHVSWHDAKLFCEWAGKRLPTEAEYEIACMGGKSNMKYPWGDKLKPADGKFHLNIWQGVFPEKNTAVDGYVGLAPVTAFGPQNSLGLHNIVGNVWEWTEDWMTTKHSPKLVRNPSGPTSGTDKVKKGGSFMCHKKFCYRYRCAARHWNTPDTSSINIGFRCASNHPPVTSNGDLHATDEL